MDFFKSIQSGQADPNCMLHFNAIHATLFDQTNLKPTTLSLAPDLVLGAKLVKTDKYFGESLKGFLDTIFNKH